MDSARRGTVLPPEFALSSGARSGIPQPSTSIPIPSSAMKKPTPAARLRQSMAGPPPMLANVRSSLYPSQVQNVPQSAQKGGALAFGRTPLRNGSVRKGGTWGGGGRPSMVPPTPGHSSHALKDPRNIRDKGTQSSMRAVIYTWLLETEYPGTISKQTLLSPTAKDFRSIFEHLVSLIDPAFEFTSDAGTGQGRDRDRDRSNGKKFEDEVVLVLKAHNFPFADAVDKKWLAAPASMHSWPQLLAVLHWLVGMSKAKLYYLDSQDATLQNTEQLPDDFNDGNHHAALTFQYLNDAYGQFLQGSDDFSGQDRYVEDRYSKKDEVVVAEVDALKARIQDMAVEYQILTTHPAPKDKLEEDNRHLREDSKKIENVLLHYENRKRKVLDGISREQSEIEEETMHLQRLREEQERLAVVVKEQNLSPEEVAQMNAEQETLVRNLEELRKRTTETSNHMRSLEVALAKRSENVEQAVDEYTELLDRVGIFPNVPPPLPLAGTDLRLEVNFASPNPRELVRRVADDTLQTSDLRGDIKSVLDSVADYKRREHMRLEDEAVNVENELDDVAGEADRLEEVNLELERKVGNVQEEAEAIRVATQQETVVSNGEAVRLQKELAHARSVALASGVGVKSRLQALQIAYQEQTERVERLKDETVRNVVKSSSDIAAFKEEVSNHLNNLRQFAEEN